MTTNKIIQGEINKIAETHFYLRVQLEIMLKRTQITEEGKPFALGCSNYYDYWTKSLNDNFFDMGTYIRLGTSIESGLKKHYMDKKGHKNLVKLQLDPKYKMNIFQKIQSWTNDNAIELFESEFGIDLNTIETFKELQRIMLHRHLYAHNSGLINEKYIQNLKTLTGIDLMTAPEIVAHYPNEDVYYFKPLKTLNKDIEFVRKFFNVLNKI